MRSWLLLGVAISFLVLGGITWFFFFRTTPTEQPATQNGGFGTGASQSVNVTPEAPAVTTTSSNNAQTLTGQKIFRVVNGPVAGATVIQTSRPTTTITRYVQQHNGHVFDLTLDSSGAVPKAVSNTTIPGITRVLWAGQGEAAILQYLDGTLIKTVSLTFPPQSATTTRPVVIKFLPDGIQDIAVSPSGASVAYLLRTQTGVRGYVAALDGTGSRESFTLPLKEVSLVWVSQNTLLLYTKSAVGAPGVSFSVNVSSGAVVPLLHATGLTLTADPTYSYIVYQIRNTESSGPSTYVRAVQTGQNSALSFSAYPERCVWGTAATSTLYCAMPLTYVPTNYLDLWYMGAAQASEAIYTASFPGGRSSILAVPGGEEGGVESTIDSLSVSPDETYLLFVRRGDRSLWGVRLQ